MVNEIVKKIKGISCRHDLYTVWSDFLALSAIAISNAVDYKQCREDQYLEIAGKYNAKELGRLKELFQAFIDSFPTPGKDVLGAVFMELGIASKWKGQFFTPDDVCAVMSHILIDDQYIKDQVDKNGYVRLSEPSIGGGATVIAFANRVTELGFNHQKHLLVTGIDVDIKSVHMSYIQLSLMGVKATIIHGNTLSMDEWSQWSTPLKLHRFDGGVYAH